MARPPKYADEEILDRALELFWTRGWSATSIRELETQLDLKAPAIYRRFGSKDGLSQAVLGHYVDRVVRRRIEKYLPGEGDPLDNIREFLVSGVRPAADGGPLIGCLLTTTALETPEVSPDLGAALMAGQAIIEAAIRRELERATEAGALAPGLDVDGALSMLTLAWHGLMVLARSGEAPEVLARRANAAADALAA